MAVVNKIYSGGKRVLQKRNSAQQVIFNDADIVLVTGINKLDRDNVGSIVLKFDTVMTKIYSTWIFGNNANLIREDVGTNSIVKNLNINQDNNGAGNGRSDESVSAYLYFSDDIENVSQLEISQTISGSIQSVDLNIIRNLPNLVYYNSLIAQVPNWLFISAIPSIKYLTFVSRPSTVSNLIYLKQSGLLGLDCRGMSGVTQAQNFIQNLPPTIQVLKIYGSQKLEVDLSDFFTGNRVGLMQQNANGGETTQPFKRLYYSGGGIFPSTLTEEQMKVDYIIRQSPYTPTKLTPDMVSQFIIDFANQVVAVNLTYKRMLFAGSTANLSYVDNSKPLYKTYTAALNYITTTLGITVQFT